MTPTMIACQGAVRGEAGLSVTLLELTAKHPPAIRMKKELPTVCQVCIRICIPVEQQVTYTIIRAFWDDGA